MGIKRGGGQASYWKSQLPIDYIDTSLTINNWETVSSDLSGGKPAALKYIIVEQTNNGATVETIELEITINGTAYTWTLTGIASGALVYCFMSLTQTGGDFTTAADTNSLAVGSGYIDIRNAWPFYADNVSLIRVRQTTDVDGTSAQIEVNIIWDKLIGV